ncbi:MAG: DUF6249 domain-containing protein [Chthoniobacterales bacterium]
MKITLITTICSLALALTAPSQTTSPPPAAAGPAATAVLNPAMTPAAGAVATNPVAAATVAPSVAPSASPQTEDDFDKAIENRIRRHFKGDNDGNHHEVYDSDVPWIAVPIVFIVFLCIFGLPVAIVGLIMYFSFSKSRAMHKTVRMMVEKGQPVPEALLNPPPVIRQRSDLRRGVVLLMVGAGLMVFFGAVNDWEGGAWSLGIIPFLIGLGYLLVWRLDVHKDEASPKV